MSSLRGNHFVQTRLLPSAAALGLASACSLMIEFEDKVDEGQEAVGQDGPDVDASSGAAPGVVEPADGGAEAVSIEGLVLDAGAAPTVIARDPLYLAFIEDPAEDQARLRLVDVPAALDGSSPSGPLGWRQTLIPNDQTGAALDFAWSPDGQQLALRYESLQGPRFAFFAAPSWDALPVAELSMPASQPVLAATGHYEWSPDSRTLVAELTSAEGPFVAGYALDGAGARALLPIEFSTGIETMAWFASNLLLTVQPAPDAREVIALGLSGSELGPERVLPSGSFLTPLELRRIPAGVMAASREPLSWFYFWPANVDPEFELGYTGYSFLSNGQRFVAETENVSNTASIELLGGTEGVLDVLPECPVVLAWGEGATAGKLDGSRIACLRVIDGAATLRFYSFAAGGLRSELEGGSAALRAELGVTSNWEGHARTFSPDNNWLALASAGRDVLIDLRGEAAGGLDLANTLAGTSASAFSPSGKYLLSQRGTTLRMIVLPAAPAGFPVLVPLPLPNAAIEAPACSTAPHVADWCGAAAAARTSSARWSSAWDVAVLLTRDEGLSTLGIGDAPGTFARTSVSTCGAECVGQFAFNL